MVLQIRRFREKRENAFRLYRAKSKGPYRARIGAILLCKSSFKKSVITLPFFSFLTDIYIRVTRRLTAMFHNYVSQLRAQLRSQFAFATIPSVRNPYVNRS